MCKRFHYAQLVDVNGDGRLDLLCPDEQTFPQKIYDTSTFPWKKLFDAATPGALFPRGHECRRLRDRGFQQRWAAWTCSFSSGVQFRPSSVVQGGPNKIEAMLAGGSKGFKFVSTGTVTFTINWNKAAEGGAHRYHQDTDWREWHASHRHHLHSRPVQSYRVGHAPGAHSAVGLPLMQIGYDPTHSALDAVRS